MKKTTQKSHWALKIAVWCVTWAKVADAMLQSDADLGTFFDNMVAEWPKRAFIPNPERLIATSNLSAEIFKQMIKGVGVSYLPSFALSEKTVIDALVIMRNGLAHGEWQIVEESVYYDFRSRIDTLMVSICDEIETAARESLYRRQV